MKRLTFNQVDRKLNQKSNFEEKNDVTCTLKSVQRHSQHMRPPLGNDHNYINIREVFALIDIQYIDFEKYIYTICPVGD